MEQLYPFTYLDSIFLTTESISDISKYTGKKAEAAATLSLVRPDLASLAEIQVGRLPSDVPPTAPIVHAAPLFRWPKEFTVLNGEQLKILLGLYTAFLELGYVFHQVTVDVPRRPDPALVRDTTDLRGWWLKQASIADIVMRQTEKELYGGYTAVVIKLFTRQHVVPTYQSLQLLRGFWLLRAWREGQYIGHAQLSFMRAQGWPCCTTLRKS